MNLLNKIKTFFGDKEKIKQLEERLQRVENEGITRTDLQEGVKQVLSQKPVEKLISKTIFNVNTGSLSVILFDGSILDGQGISQEKYLEIQNCNDRQCLLNLLSPPREEKVVNTHEEEEQEIKEQISSLVDILKEVDDFDVVGDKVFLKGVKSIELPSSIVAEFIRLIDIRRELEIYKNRGDIVENPYFAANQEYQSLLMFTRWLLMNPIESARQDCLTFVKKNDIKLTTNGLMQCYRRVVSKNKTNHKLVKFVSESYFKVKKNKKSPKNYEVFDDNGFVIAQRDKRHDYNNHRGNLYDLYQNLSNLQEKSYTDDYSKTKNIKIGAIYKEDEDKIDLDNTKDCSSGLHVGSKNFGFSGFGDVGVLALVNPMYVRSVPVSDAHKMRVSEMFIATTMEKEDYDNLEDIIDFSEEYCNTTVEELTENLKNKSFSNLSCQDNLPVLNLKEVENLTQILAKRVVQI